MSIKKQTYQDLPKQVYSDLFGIDATDRKSKKELSDFKIDYILKDDNNNIYLLAEEWYYKDSNLYSIGRRRTNKVYGAGKDKSGYVNKYYDDIIILKFDKDWNINWGRSIYKRDVRPSYNSFVKNNELHIILNSGKDLKQLTDGRTKTSKGIFENSSLYDFVYSQDGKSIINKIQDNKNKTYYLPNYGTYVGGKFVMINDSRKYRKFMTLN